MLSRGGLLILLPEVREIAFLSYIAPEMSVRVVFKAGELENVFEALRVS